MAEKPASIVLEIKQRADELWSQLSRFVRKFRQKPSKMESSRVPSSLNHLSLPLSRGQLKTRAEAKEQEAVIHERLKRANQSIPPYEFQNYIGKGSYGRVYVA